MPFTMKGSVVRVARVRLASIFSPPCSIRVKDRVPTRVAMGSSVPVKFTRVMIRMESVNHALLRGVYGGGRGGGGRILRVEGGCNGSNGGRGSVEGLWGQGQRLDQDDTRHNACPRGGRGGGRGGCEGGGRLLLGTYALSCEPMLALKLNKSRMRASVSNSIMLVGLLKVTVMKSPSPMPSS